MSYTFVVSFSALLSYFVFSWYLCVCVFREFFHIFYWLCYYTCPLFSPLFPSTLHTASHLHPPLLRFKSMGHTYKFFGFYISYTILKLPLFSTYHLCYLFPVPFPHSPLPPHCWEPSMWSPFLWFCSCSSCLLSLFLALYFFRLGC